jgi:hypothetical protein
MARAEERDFERVRMKRARKMARKKERRYKM